MRVCSTVMELLVMHGTIDQETAHPLSALTFIELQYCALINYDLKLIFLLKSSCTLHNDLWYNILFWIFLEDNCSRKTTVGITEHLDCDGWSGGESMFSGLCKDWVWSSLASSVMFVMFSLFVIDSSNGELQAPRIFYLQSQKYSGGN